MPASIFNATVDAYKVEIARRPGAIQRLGIFGDMALDVVVVNTNAERVMVATGLLPGTPSRFHLKNL